MNWGPADYESAALTGLAKGDASSHPEYKKRAYIAVSPYFCVGKMWGIRNSVSKAVINPI